MGIRTVAVYSEADRDSMHVKLADESICIGPPEPPKSYLDIPRLMAAMEVSSAEGVHPGYGFLSENPKFAQIVEASGKVFIGPSAGTLELIGDKIKAKEVAKKVGIPLVPGSDGPVDFQKALEIAKEIKYPVVIKSAAGGGGRGIRVVYDEKELREKLPLAMQEAKSAFGDERVYVEKYIVNPKHIEVQVLADRYGNVIALGERDCSIQRRYQKLVEIAPSLLLTPEQREYYGSLVVKAAKEIGYYNAGTMEFVADEKGNLYFIEMNTRIQVEHPVTEMVTGVDIVKWQILIAAGERLPYKQEDIKFNGYSIECRINAEDPKKGFAPSIGTIERYYVPGGFGIRVEHAASRGFEVTPYYDSMIAKLIVWAPTWEDAVDRMRAALETYEITGVKTTIPLLINIMKDPDFRAGKFTTKYLEEKPHLFDYPEHRDKEDFVAIIASAIASYHGL
jgi:acetyl-coenzyme A carboxylase carboxyl transferase subunit alpha 